MHAPLKEVKGDHNSQVVVLAGVRQRSQQRRIVLSDTVGWVHGQMRTEKHADDSQKNHHPYCPYRANDQIEPVALFEGVFGTVPLCLDVLVRSLNDLFWLGNGCSGFVHAPRRLRCWSVFFFVKRGVNVPYKSQKVFLIFLG